MDEPNSEFSVSRRQFLKKGRDLLLAAALPDFMVSYKPNPEVRLGRDRAYDDFLNRVVRDVPPTYDQKETVPLAFGLGYATLHGDEKTVGVPAAMYNAYCAVFRARLDRVTPDILPPRLKYVFQMANLYDLYLKLWDGKTQVQKVQAEMSYETYRQRVCTSGQLADKLLIPADSDLLKSPDAEKLLATPRVMSVGATPLPFVLGARYLVYSVVPEANGTFSRNLVGTTLAVDVPTRDDQVLLDSVKYNTPPWDRKPIPWIFDASTALFNRLPSNGQSRQSGGRPGVLMVSEETYRKFHPVEAFKNPSRY